MSEPTKQSLEEAADLLNADSLTTNYLICGHAVKVLARTLDQLHGRKPPVDPLTPLLADILDALNLTVTANDIRIGERQLTGAAAIAILRKAIEDATRPVDETTVTIALKAGDPNFCGTVYWHMIPVHLKNAGFQIIRSPTPEVGK